MIYNSVLQTNSFAGSASTDRTAFTSLPLKPSQIANQQAFALPLIPLDVVAAVAVAVLVTGVSINSLSNPAELGKAIATGNRYLAQMTAAQARKVKVEAVKAFKTALSLGSPYPVAIQSAASSVSPLITAPRQAPLFPRGVSEIKPINRQDKKPTPPPPADPQDKDRRRKPTCKMMIDIDTHPLEPQPKNTVIVKVHVVGHSNNSPYIPTLVTLVVADRSEKIIHSEERSPNKIDAKINHIITPKQLLKPDFKKTEMDFEGECQFNKGALQSAKLENLTINGNDETLSISNHNAGFYKIVFDKP